MTTETTPRDPAEFTPQLLLATLSGLRLTSTGRPRLSGICPDLFTGTRARVMGS